MPGSGEWYKSVLNKRSKNRKRERFLREEAELRERSKSMEAKTDGKKLDKDMGE